MDKRGFLVLVLIGISLSLTMGCIDKEQPLIVEIPESTLIVVEIPPEIIESTPEIIESTPEIIESTPQIIVSIAEHVTVTPQPTATPTPEIIAIPEDVRNYYTWNKPKQYAEWQAGDGISLYCIETGKDIGWYYNMDIFDCSEMSAAYERAFENAGYNAKIAAGYGINGGHAWVMVEKEDIGDGVNWLWFEATCQQFQPASTYKKYLVDCMTFDNINEALEYNEEDFNWWEDLEDFENVVWV